MVHADEPLGIADLIKGVGALYASYMSIIMVPAAFARARVLVKAKVVERVKEKGSKRYKYKRK